MGCMAMPLADVARKLLAVVMPFGFYECCVLPMGVSSATDKFQARMVGLFVPMTKSERTDPYIDDILHTKGKNFGEHLQMLDEILERLETSRVQINLKKSTLCAKTLELLGFQLKPTGYRPTRKRVEDILRLDAPSNVRGVRRVLGIVNFIKNHIPVQAQILAPLTNLTKKEVMWRWKEEE